MPSTDTDNRWRWAIADNVKCIGRWVQTPVGKTEPTALNAVFRTPKHYLPPNTQQAMNDNGAKYAEFMFSGDAIQWGDPMESAVAEAFLHEGLPHKSEWLK